MIFEIFVGRSDKITNRRNGQGGLTNFHSNKKGG